MTELAASLGMRFEPHPFQVLEGSAPWRLKRRAARAAGKRTGFKSETSSADAILTPEQFTIVVNALLLLGALVPPSVTRLWRAA